MNPVFYYSKLVLNLSSPSLSTSSGKAIVIVTTACPGCRNGSKIVAAPTMTPFFFPLAIISCSFSSALKVTRARVHRPALVERSPILPDSSGTERASRHISYDVANWERTEDKSVGVDGDVSKEDVKWAARVETCHGEANETPARTR